jgi:biopolymer transport protein ExbD
MVDGAGPKKKAAPGVRRKSRVSMRIDMTPMVDIAFLLVIFFMTTTRFREPQAIEITLPKPGKPKKTKQSNVLVLEIDAQGKLTQKIGEDQPQPVEVDSLEPLLVTRERENILRRSDGDIWARTYDRALTVLKDRPDYNPYKDTLRMIKEDISKITVLIQVDPRSRYKSVIEVMDAVNHARMSRFSVVRAGTLDQYAQPAAPGQPGAFPPAPTGFRSEPKERVSC